MILLRLPVLQLVGRLLRRSSIERSPTVAGTLSSCWRADRTSKDLKTCGWLFVIPWRKELSHALKIGCALQKIATLAFEPSARPPSNCARPNSNCLVRPTELCLLAQPTAASDNHHIGCVADCLLNRGPETQPRRGSICRRHRVRAFWLALSRLRISADSTSAHSF